MSKIMRPATHAGSWYSGNPNELNKQLDGWLQAVPDNLVSRPARAIISPHAGYMYSGRCAAFAFKQIDPSIVKRIFVLGPSHHAHLSGCGLSSYAVYETPIGNLTIDRDIYQELVATGRRFETLSLDVDHDEHSIEMMLSYISKIMDDGQREFKIVPVMVGSLSKEQQIVYGKVFAPYLADPANVFVISSDFCHWGERFNYTYYDNTSCPIHESIKQLDHKGMDLIESLDLDKFCKYLKESGNTVCGAKPIGILIAAANELKTDAMKKLTFVQYEQSHQCLKQGDSSVSYASATFTLQ